MTAALLTGCRYGELTTLEASAFDPDNETIFVEKTKNSKPRHVALNGEGVAFFSEMTAQRQPSERMFLRANGKSWKTSEQQRAVTKVSIVYLLRKPPKVPVAVALGYKAMAK